jgi:aspartate/glutamate racemase
LIEIAEKFGDFGAKTVLLACTDLQLLVPKSKKMKIVDTMKIYAQAVVNKILER